jgi:hypothetical protein
VLLFGGSFLFKSLQCFLEGVIFIVIRPLVALLRARTPMDSDQIRLRFPRLLASGWLPFERRVASGDLGEAPAYFSPEQSKVWGELKNRIPTDWAQDHGVGQ